MNRFLDTPGTFGTLRFVLALQARIAATAGGWASVVASAWGIIAIGWGLPVDLRRMALVVVVGGVASILGEQAADHLNEGLRPEERP